MKLWDVVKGEGLNATYNLCGYPIYKIIEKQNLRERKFCHGLISSKKTVDYSKGIYLRELFICGLCISQRGIYNYKLFLKFFGITLRNEDVSIAFYKKYKSK